MTAPIEPGHVMSQEQFDAIQRRTLAESMRISQGAIDSYRNDPVPRKRLIESRHDEPSLLDAVRSVMGGPFESERIKAQQEAKCASNGTK